MTDPKVTARAERVARQLVQIPRCIYPDRRHVAIAGIIFADNELKDVATHKREQAIHMIAAALRKAGVKGK